MKNEGEKYPETAQKRAVRILFFSFKKLYTGYAIKARHTGSRVSGFAEDGHRLESRTANKMFK